MSFYFKKQDVKKYRINKPILEFKTVARESVHAPHSKFKMIFYFLCDDEYQEERGAKRHLGTLGAEK